MREETKYKSLYLTRNWAEFIFYIYLPLYLKNLNYSGTMIGTILSFSPLLIVIALPVWGKVENIIERKYIIIIAAALTVTMQYFLIIPSSFVIIASLTVLYSFVRAPLYPSIDSIATIYCIEKKLEFSSLRAWGSFGYLLAVLLGGVLFDYVAFIWIVLLSTVLFVALIYSSAAIQPLEVDADKLARRNRKGSLKQLLMNPFFVKFLIAQVLCYTAICVNNVFDILYLTNRGVATSVFGLISMARISFEIVCFKYIRRSNFSYKTLFAAVPVMMLTQSVLYFFRAPIIMLFSTVIFTGTAIGIIIYLNNKYIGQIVRPKNITLATYVTAIVQNLSIAIFTFFGGMVYDLLGPNNIYLFTGISFTIGFVFIAIFINKTGRYTIVKYYDD